MRRDVLAGGSGGQDVVGVAARAQSGTVTIAGPEIEIDLEALAAGTKVHAARLVVFRDTIDGTMDEALQPIEISPRRTAPESRSNSSRRGTTPST